MQKGRRETEKISKVKGCDEDFYINSKIRAQYSRNVFVRTSKGKLLL